MLAASETEAELVRREYEAARTAAGLVELPQRGVLAVSGPQRQKFLHNLLSNDVAGLEPDRGCLAALMTPKGHLVALMRVLMTADAVLLEMPAARLAPVEETFQRYKVGTPVRFAVKPVAILGLLGPQAAAVLLRVGAAAPEPAPEAHVVTTIAGHETRVARASDLPAGGLVLHVAPEAAAAVRQSLVDAGAIPVSQGALDALRVEDGCPWYGTDVTEENLLHETGLLAQYHSSSKGCYVGQEVVARLEARGGHVNKRLRGLRLTIPAAVGAPVLHEGQAVGRLTTTAVSPRLGPIALAFVHRSQGEPGTVVAVGGAPATVAALPFSR